MSSLCDHHGIIMSSSCHHHVTIMSSSWHHHGIIIKYLLLIFTSVLSRKAANFQFNGFWFHPTGLVPAIDLRT
jgi:hypothetical protein